MLKLEKVEKLILTSYGNSIASGYTRTGNIEPLLLRNNTLKEILESENLKLEVHNFARCQNNSDERLYSWLINNISENEINAMARFDLTDKEYGMDIKIKDTEKIDKYYPLNIENCMHLSDLVEISGEHIANIIIYNGCTGSLLDNITRDGNGFKGIERDLISLEAILQYIQSKNREKNTNTQVYICGRPIYFGLKNVKVINSRLEEIAKKYANTVYVEPVNAKVIYTNSDNAHLDIHYDDEEYIKFINNIIKAINENYVINKASINIDRNLYKFSSDIEFKKVICSKNNNSMAKCVMEIIKIDYSRVCSKQNRDSLLKRIGNYVLNRFPYDFYYIGKNNFKNALKRL